MVCARSAMRQPDIDVLHLQASLALFGPWAGTRPLAVYLSVRWPMPGDDGRRRSGSGSESRFSLSRTSGFRLAAPQRLRSEVVAASMAGSWHEAAIGPASIEPSM